MVTTYAYNALGQLIRVNDPHEIATWIYNYDRGGNITSKVKYAYTTGTLGTAAETTPYVYADSNWKDKLTSYNGQTITYDAIGNPLNDGTWSYTWGAGRQLRQMSKAGTAVQFKYDHNGLRTQKIVTENGVTSTTNYTLHGKLITHMTKGTDSLHFFYDAQSRPAKVRFNGALYTYVHNLQGDIVGLLDSNGTLVVEYRYDAWGRKLSTTGSLAATLGKHNPFRYRGYVYDEETELYYLRSRYYNPETERFLNVDKFGGTKGKLISHNAFAYCNNAPVENKDSNGQWMGLAILVIGVSLLLTGCSSNSNNSSEYSGQANCYAYALKLSVDPRTNKPFRSKPQPGEFAEKSIMNKDWATDAASTKKLIVESVMADCEVLGMTIEEVSSSAYVCEDGEWLVALAYAPEWPDYHWWRQNEDGTWYHKPGSTSIRTVDDSGEMITDPAICDRGAYSEFLGYYVISTN